MNDNRNSGPGSPLQAIFLIPIAVAYDYVVNAGKNVESAIDWYHNIQAALYSTSSVTTQASAANAVAASGVHLSPGVQLVGVVLFVVAGFVILRSAGSGMNKKEANKEALAAGKVVKPWAVPSVRQFRKRIKDTE